MSLISWHNGALWWLLSSTALLGAANGNQLASSKTSPLTQFAARSDRCDWFQGSWVHDKTYPFYDPSVCPFLIENFACQRNGRPDKKYLKYRWKPSGCEIPRFDAHEFLKRFTGKTIMFVGDSLGVEQWQSLTCMLYAAVPNTKYTLGMRHQIREFNFTEYNLSINMEWHQYLVDIDDEPNVGRVLKLQSIKGGDTWKNTDVLIFDSWHWWFTQPPHRPWDYVQVGKRTYKDMDRLKAFKIALQTWTRWVDQNINPLKTTVFFQGISAKHFQGKDWGQPKVSSCLSVTQPLSGSTNLTGLGLDEGVQIIKEAFGGIKKPVFFLDVTRMTGLRPDAHTQAYSNHTHTVHDCVHWCIFGVPDSWNQIVFAKLQEA